MFSHYFPGDGEVGPVPVNSDVTFPQWRSSQGFAKVDVFLPAWLILKIKASWRVLKLIWLGPGLEKAFDIVKEVAHTEGMGAAKKSAWGPIGEYMGKQPGAGENIYRHMLAAMKWGEHNGPRWERDTLLQVAYLAYKKRKS
jgi:hypothetical protein